MAPKKKGAFTLFCREYCQQHSSGGKNMSLKEATELAAPLWTKMTERERQKYREQAKKPKTTVVKYTTQGIPIGYIENAEEELKRYESNMLEDISNTISAMAAVRSLQDLDVCVFHFNSFCYAKSQKRHYPAELAVAKFNLKQGVWDVYHAICNPGPLPLGYAAVVQAKSDETHQLPVPDAPNNLEQIFYEVISFVDDRGNRSKPPPLYVPPDNYAEAKEFLSSLCTDYGFDPLFLDVYSLTHLFYEMRNAAAGKIVFPSVTFAISEFERDVYEYAVGICCSVHQDLGQHSQCSKSIVIRNSFMICDNCCRDMRIDIVAGKHVPFNIKTSEILATDEQKYKRENDGKSLSINSKPVTFSSATDDDNSSVSSSSLTMNVSSLNFEDSEDGVTFSRLRSKLKTLKLYSGDDAETGAAPPSSSASTSRVQSCSTYEKRVDQYFEHGGSSQGSVVPALNFLSQNITVENNGCDEDGFKTVVRKSRKAKATAGGSKNFKMK